MIIGVPKEIKLQEHRIGLTPESVKVLTSKGHEVLVQNNGGFELAYDNDYYDLYINLKSHNQFQELPGDVGVNTGDFSSSNGFHVDPRSSDTLQDFSQNNGHQLFYGGSINLNNSLSDRPSLGDHIKYKLELVVFHFNANSVSISYVICAYSFKDFFPLCCNFVKSFLG